MNFLVCEATYLRYFCPLVIEGNKMGIKSHFFLRKSGKYNCCFKPNANRQIQKFCNEFNVDVHPIDDIKNYHGLTFLIEGVDIDRLGPDHKKVVITYMTDYSYSYPNYIKKADFIIMPSEYFATKYQLASEKNLFLGSPKYDITINPVEVRKKYDLKDSGKNALFIFPRTRDIGKSKIEKLYGFIERLGFNTIIKTRGKDEVPTHLRRGAYFTDESWFPHTTMELIASSDIVINFSSSAVKECIMLHKPIINFDIKPFELVLDDLYKPQYCSNLQPSVNFQSFAAEVDRLVTENLDHHFNEAISRYLFEAIGTAHRILVRLLGEN